MFMRWWVQEMRRENEIPHHEYIARQAYRAGWKDAVCAADQQAREWYAEWMKHDFKAGIQLAIETLLLRLEAIAGEKK
jgi:hypothetical protein